MSIECSNTSPFVSRFDNQALTPVSDIFTGLTDFSTLIDQANPLDKVDRDSVVTITNKLNAVLTTENANGNLTEFPTLKNKFEQFPLTFVEIADYVLKNSVDTTITLESLNQYSPTIGMNNSLTSLASGLDFFFDANLGASISGGQCAAFGELLTGLSLLFDMIDTGQKLIADIKSLDLDPVKLAKTIAGKLQIQALIDKVEAIIDKLIEKVKLEILQAINSIIPQLKAMGCASKSLFKKLDREITDIKEHFSDANMDLFKEKVKEFFTNITTQFERTSVENLALLMYRLCQFTELLQELLTGPSKDLLRAAEVIAVEAKVLGIVSKKNIKKAVENGATRLSPETVKEKREKVIKAYGSDLTDEHLTDPCPTAEEIQIISGITNKGLTDKILFASSKTSLESAIDAVSAVTSAPVSIPGIPESVNIDQSRSIEIVDPVTGIITLSETDIGEAGVIKKIVDGVTGVVTTEIVPAVKDLASKTSELLSFDDSTFNDPLKKEWSSVDISIWSKLLRVQKQTGSSYTVLHGVKEKTSVTAKMGGRSNHIHLTPYAIDISVNDENRERTIKAASKSGFTGIGIYKTYLHLDTGARRSWVAGQADIDIKSSEQFVNEELVEMERLATMHDSDDHRKARITPLQEIVNVKNTVSVATPKETQEAVNNIKNRSYNAL